MQPKRGEKQRVRPKGRACERDARPFYFCHWLYYIFAVWNTYNWRKKNCTFAVHFWFEHKLLIKIATVYVYSHPAFSKWVLPPIGTSTNEGARMVSRLGSQKPKRSQGLSDHFAHAGTSSQIQAFFKKIIQNDRIFFITEEDRWVVIPPDCTNLSENCSITSTRTLLCCGTSPCWALQRKTLLD